MDESTRATQRKRLERTALALEKANMQAFIAPDAQKVCEIIKELLPKGASVTVGGSMTLFEAGVIDLLKSGDYDYADRYREGIEPHEIAKIYRDAFSAEFYIASTNALTENGELVNVDGNSNRVAAIGFGPKNVIVVCGANKIVKDINEAVSRIKAIAAPSNVNRLDCKTPCAQTGKCENCHSPNCICCTWTVHRHSRIKNRIKVVLVEQSLGY